MNIAVPTSAFTAVSAIVAATATSAIVATIATTSAAIATTVATSATAGEIFRASNYDDLIRGFVERKKQLGLTNLDLDALAGYADGYSSKLFARKRMKGLAYISLPCLLGALDLELVAVEKPRKAKPKPA
jgi:hypothetical protein